MTCVPGMSMFSPEFLSLSSRHDPTPASTPEAVWAGPWHVERRGEEYAVVCVGGDKPEAVVSFRETALLLAAVLPGCGRGQLYWLEPPDAGGHLVSLRTVLVARGPACVGRLRHRSDELLVPLSTAEYFLRSPVALSYLLEAAPLETLRKAGAERMRRVTGQDFEPGEPPCPA